MSPAFKPDIISSEPSNVRPSFTLRRSKCPFPFPTKMYASLPSRITADAGTRIPCVDDRSRRIEPNIAGLIRASAFGRITRTCKVRVMGSTASGNHAHAPVPAFARIGIQRHLRCCARFRRATDLFRKISPTAQTVVMSATVHSGAGAESACENSPGAAPTSSTTPERGAFTSNCESRRDPDPCRTPESALARLPTPPSPAAHPPAPAEIRFRKSRVVLEQILRAGELFLLHLIVGDGL